MAKDEEIMFTMMHLFIILLVIAILATAGVVTIIVVEIKKSKTTYVNDDQNEYGGEPELKVVVKDGVTQFYVVEYSKSFEAKLIQSNDVAKKYYSELKNMLLSYEGVESRITWRWELFRVGEKIVAKIRIRGNTPSLLLPLDPEQFAGTKYYVNSFAGLDAYAETPCLYRIKSDKRLRYAGELISLVMKNNGICSNMSVKKVDYAEKYPYETTNMLIARNQIKVLTDVQAPVGSVFSPQEIYKSMDAAQADSILRDDIAEALICKSDRISDTTLKCAVSLGTLAKCFTEGEIVTIEGIRRRIKVDPKTSYVKIIEKGTLTKPLIIEADEFSLPAVKMITLMGGTAIKKG